MIRLNHRKRLQPRKMVRRGVNFLVGNGGFSMISRKRSKTFAAKMNEEFSNGRDERGVTVLILLNKHMRERESARVCTVYIRSCSSCGVISYYIKLA